MSKLERLRQANDVINAISAHGRRFFYRAGSGRTGELRLGHRGHIFFVDPYCGAVIYTAYRGHWRGFSSGGTMRNLVEALSDFVRNGEQLNHGCIAPSYWGYGPAASAAVQEATRSSAVFHPSTTQRSDAPTSDSQNSI